MSWKSAACPSSSSSACESDELPADRERELLHAARVAGRVGVARVDRRRERLHRRGRALLEQLVRLLERHVLRLDRLGGSAQLVRRALRVLEVGLLRLAHQEERQREDDDRPGADRHVRLVDDGRDEAVDGVVRRQPAESLLEDPQRVLAALDADGDRDETHVDDEVDEPGEQAAGDEDARADPAVEADREDRRGAERGERQRTDVEEQLVEDGAARAPLDRRHGDREHECCARADDRRRRERTDGADGDRARLLHLERQHLAEADERRRS